MIDISQPTPYEIEQAGGFGSIRGLFDAMGKMEGIRQDREILNRYVTAMAADPTADPARIIAGLEEPQYAPGLLGEFQKIAGGMPGGQGSVLGQLQASLVGRTTTPAKTTLSDHKLRLIEKKLAADPKFEGSPEHLRLLGVAGAKTETPEEKLKRLQALRKSAAGQYFGIEGGNMQPLYPKVHEYAEKEIAKLPMFAEEEEPETIDITPDVSTDVWPMVPPGVGQRIKQALDNDYTKEEILKWLKEQGYNDYAGSSQ